MKTLVEHAKEGTITERFQMVAKIEHVDPRLVCRRVAQGKIAIMCREGVATGIGSGLKTKVNVNIGTSPLKINLGEEVEKARIAEKYGADTITDLSMGGNIPVIRGKIFENTTLPITTVPIYQTVAEVGLENMTENHILQTIRRQAREGVSSFVLHCTNNDILDILKKKRRIIGVVSKGGSLTIAYMVLNRCDNPFIEYFDDILKILKRHDIVLSLGNTMRSGCIHDQRDDAQMGEMKLNGTLAKRAHEEGVQVIIEGVGGHVRADHISRYVKSYKRHLNFPLFVAGPLPTDIAVGYDHIAGCVGASIASGAGADYLCYITPAEHLGLPNPEQVKEGLIAFKIAAHIGNSIKYGLHARDRELSKRRANLDWEGQQRYAIDTESARALFPKDGACTMCGDFCAIKMMKELSTKM